MRVSQLGRGIFKGQFETTDQASAVLARSPVDFHMAMGFLDRWTQGMDFTCLDVGLLVISRFLVLLTNFASYLQEIGRSSQYVVGNCMVPDENCIITMRLALSFFFF